MKKNITEHIKTQQPHLDLDTPPMDVWENIEQALEENEKKRGFIYWRYAAGIALLIAVGTSIWWFNTGEKQLIPNDKLVVHSPVKDSSSVVHHAEQVDSVTLTATTDTLSIVTKEFYYAQLERQEVVHYEKISHSYREHNVIASKLYSIQLNGRVRNYPIKDGVKINPNPAHEQYDHVLENDFVATSKEPMSTFSIDVDVASYSNIRRMILEGKTPPSDAVRIEEMINYFNYEYAAPKGKKPFSIETKLMPCPWKPKHKLVKIGLQGKRIEAQEAPANNLVFLLDVSGSMMSDDKLGLLKKSFKLLTDQLRAKDHVSIVVYAGASGIVLPPTPGNEKTTIMAAIDKLQAGGSTAGGEGIQLAYATAEKHFDPKGNNRILLATDGDFNVGISHDDSLVALIEEKRESGVFLTVLGVGTGNLQDAKMEKLADNGNGQYAYLDNILEAKKVLVTEMGATLNTIAKDVKIQIEFNPAHVQAYRLIGYENRVLDNQDFANDAKDAGDLGAGHNVTALYEIIPKGVKMDSLYQPYKYSKVVPKAGLFDNELCTVRFRYKKPDGDKSKLIEEVVHKHLSKNTTSNDHFAIAVTEFGLLLKNSKYKGNINLDKIIALAKANKGSDESGYRQEFIRLVEAYQALQK